MKKKRHVSNQRFFKKIQQVLCVVIMDNNQVGEGRDPSLPCWPDYSLRCCKQGWGPTGAACITTSRTPACSGPWPCELPETPVSLDSFHLLAWVQTGAAFCLRRRRGGWGTALLSRSFLLKVHHAAAPRLPCSHTPVRAGLQREQPVPQHRRCGGEGQGAAAQGWLHGSAAHPGPWVSGGGRGTLGRAVLSESCREML